MVWERHNYMIDVSNVATLIKSCAMGVQNI
jgi:hypothetical protein